MDISYNDNTIWSFWDTSYVEIDTIDSYYQIVGSDTSWIYITESNTINLSDSSYSIVTDTLKDEKSHTFSNRYKYIEIPLIIGYSINNGRFTTSLKAGVITSFLWNAQGKSITGQSANDIYSITHDDFPSVRLDLYSAIETRYLIRTRYFIFGEAYYRQTVSPFTKQNHISYRFNSYGLKLGAGMYF